MKDHLHQLIRSMSKSEKRNFKLHAAPYNTSTKNIHIELFNALDKLEHYDEALLNRALKRKSIVKNLATAKYQLSGVVLESLVSAPGKRTTMGELRALLGQSEHLYLRGHYEYCERLLARARKKARVHEAYPLLLEVLEMERMLLFRIQPDNLQAELERHHNEVRATTVQIQHIAALRSLFDQVQELYRRTTRVWRERDQQHLTALASHPHLKDSSMALCATATILRHKINASLAFIRGEFAVARNEYRSCIDTWQSRPEFMNDALEEYIRDLDKFLTCCIAAGDYEDFETAMESMQSLAPRAQPEAAHTFGRIHYLHLTYCLNTGQLAKGLEVVEHIESGLEKHRASIRPDRLNSLLFNCGIVHFLNGNHAKALEFANAILDQKNAEPNENVQQCSRILQLVIHYELGNTDILDNLLRSARRYLSKREALHEFEQIVMRGMYRLLRCADKAGVADVLRHLREELGILGKANDKVLPLGLLELVLWIDSHLQEKCISEIYTSAVSQGEGRIRPELLL